MAQDSVDILSEASRAENLQFPKEPEHWAIRALASLATAAIWTGNVFVALACAVFIIFVLCMFFRVAIGLFQLIWAISN